MYKEIKNFNLEDLVLNPEKYCYSITSLPKATEQFMLDWNKVKTVDDCKHILKAWLMSNSQSHVCISNLCEDYDKMKHLAKDGSIEKIG